MEMKRLYAMWKSLLLLALLAAAPTAWGQVDANAPFSNINSGIGQYGYLEADAVTFFDMNANTFNVTELAARTWVGVPSGSGQEFIYFSGLQGSCTTHGSLQTGDFNPDNYNAFWVAGNSMYVGIYDKFCDFNTWRFTLGGGAEGWNQREFKIIDVTADTRSLASQVVDNPTGGQNVVLSFTIDAGSGTSAELRRLFVENDGSAQEVDDIPQINGLTLYYETVTGSETFDGTEDSQGLFGDSDGSTNADNRYGNGGFNGGAGISIPDAGLRCYVVLNNLDDAFTPGETVRFSIINDGISFVDSFDGDNDMRIDVTRSSDDPITLIGETTYASGSWNPVTPDENYNAIIDDNYSESGFTCNDLTVTGSGNATGTGSYEVRGELTVESGGVMALASGSSFEMQGSAINGPGNISFDQLLINNASGVTLNAPVTVTNLLRLQDGDLVSDGNLTVELSNNSIGVFADAGNAVTGDATLRRSLPSGWNYLAAPFTDADWSDVLDDLDGSGQFPVYYYVESFAGDYEDFGAWVDAPASGAIAPGTGFIYQDAATLEMTGTLQMSAPGSISLSFSSGLSGKPASQEGWNLIANPFPSSIDWDNLDDRLTNVNGAIYAYDNGQYRSRVGGVGPFQHIAPMQAFFVQANDANPAIDFNGSARSLTTPQFFRESELDPSVVRLVLRGERYDDVELYVRFDSEATEGFDPALEAWQIAPADRSIPYFGIQTEDGVTSIDARPFLSNGRLSLPLTLRFRQNNPGEQRLQADLSTLPNGYDAWLEDHVTGQFVDLLDQPKYNFTPSANDPEDRFTLHFFARVTALADFQAESVRLYAHADRLTVELPESLRSAGQIALYDLMGKAVIAPAELQAGERAYTLHCSNLPQGVYIASFTAEGQTTSKKVVIGR